MIKFTLNDQELEVPDGTTVLQAARANLVKNAQAGRIRVVNGAHLGMINDLGSGAFRNASSSR